MPLSIKQMSSSCELFAHFLTHIDICQCRREPWLNLTPGLTSCTQVFLVWTHRWVVVRNTGDILDHLGALPVIIMKH